MQPAIETSAPGKLFLVGEYAVLDGAPAVLTAVDRRARVSLCAADDGRWRLSAPNLGLTGVALGDEGALPADLDATTRARLGLYDAVRITVLERCRAAPEPLHLVIDSAAFAADGHKLGLGSSAAVAAALTRALLDAVGLKLSKTELTMLAIAAHRRAQNGAGSGGDVAASIHGGVVSYTRDQPPQALDWPQELVGLAVVTGSGARTVDLVARVNAYRRRDATGYAADIKRLHRLADGARDALRHGPCFLALAAAYFQALAALDQHARAGIVDARHHELHALAARHDAVFKTSGAGGGDVGLVFVPRGEDRVRALGEAFANAGAAIVPLMFGADGVRREN